jgi:hypothetical protein
MSEIIERLARVIHPGAFQQDERIQQMYCWPFEVERVRSGARKTSRDILEALREPTDDMMIEAEVAVPSLRCLKDKPDSPSYLAWQAMIDAALKVQP